MIGRNIPTGEVIRSCEITRVSGSRPSTLKVTRLLSVATFSGTFSRKTTWAGSIFLFRIGARASPPKRHVLLTRFIFRRVCDLRARNMVGLACNSIMGTRDIRL